jgi:hypothetical protein
MAANGGGTTAAGWPSSSKGMGAFCLAFTPGRNPLSKKEDHPMTDDHDGNRRERA